MEHEKILQEFGISQGMQDLIDEKERKRLHRIASDYLTETQMERFDHASRILQVLIIELIEETEKYANQLNEIREHLDRTPL